MPENRPQPDSVLTRVAKARHDLRNPLGEIIGFSEILREEAGDLGHMHLQAALAALTRDARTLLEKLDATLEPGNLRDHPATVEALRYAFVDYGSGATGTVRELNEQCRALPGPPFLDDLARIAAAAGNLTESAPLLLVDLGETEHAPASFQALGRFDHEIESEIGGNTLFHRRTAARPGAAPSAGASILVADDNEANRALLTRRLVRNSHTIAHAEDGERAL